MSHEKIVAESKSHESREISLSTINSNIFFSRDFISLRYYFLQLSRKSYTMRKKEYKEHDAQLCQKC